MRLPERTRLACRAVLLLTAAPYKSSKTSVPEFSITDYLIKAHIRQHKSRPWLGPTLGQILHHCPCSGSHPGCTVHPQAPCSGSEEEGAGPLVLVSASSWIPISLTLPVLCNGVLLNGSPPSSSGSAGKNAALSNQKHMPFKE